MSRWSKGVSGAVTICVLMVMSGATSGYSIAPQSLRLWPAVDRLVQPNDAAGELIVSGFVEAEEIVVAAELGGRIVDLAVREGEEVQTGQVLVQLDARLVDAQIAVAEADLELAKARLALVRAGARPEEIRKAEADLLQALALRDGAHQAWIDLQNIRARPQELDLQIIQARTQVSVTQAALVQATTLKDAAEIAYDAYWETREKLDTLAEQINAIPEPLRPPLPAVQLDFHLIPNRYWLAWVGVNRAQAAFDGARKTLDDLYAMRANPQELNAQVIAAEAEYRAAEAAVQMAQANLDKLRAGPTKEEIAALEAQVQQAQAALERLRVLRDKQTIRAPTGGQVLECEVHVGELALPHVPLLTLGGLDNVLLTVYVPVDQLSRVFVDQSVQVTVDSWPGRSFEGKVIAIADEAEFIPRNVQVRRERVTMVFAVDIRVSNPEHALKPGMLADARFIADGK